MDAGNVNPLSPAPQAAPPRAFEVAELADEAMHSASEVDRNKSRIVALMVAALVHGILFVLLAWMVISHLKPEEVELVVEASTSNTRADVEKKSFAKRVTNEKPSPPSRMATNTISAASAVSPVVMPEVEEINDLPALGSDFGDGFGMGGFGDGRGGASFFGTSGGGNRIILVIDTSTSMNGNCGPAGIEALRREIDRTIAALSPDTRFNIICFGNDADGFAQKPIAASATAKADAKKWMQDYFINVDFTRTRTSKWGAKGTDGKGIRYVAIPPDSVGSLKGTSGGSRMDLALVAAFGQKPTAVFLIADGEPGTARGNQPMSKKEIVDLIENEAKRIYGNSRKPTVNCISVKGIGEEVLKDIARRFKGKYKAVDPAKI